MFASKKTVQSIIFLSLLIAGSVFISSSLARSLPEFTGLVKKVAPAVVNISTRQYPYGHDAMPRGFGIPELPDDSPFNELFRRFMGELGREHSLRETPSLGSGFIVSKDGYVLTAAHVVKGADEILVTLSDRREFEAGVIGVDRHSDLALLKIDAKNLPVVEFGDSDQLEVGEWVLAIGAPFGFEHSATAGIVSAKGRSLPSENYVPFIQTDVAINPGNSGGPLFDLDGKVVGVNTQIYSRTGGYMGLSFTIPANLARDVVAQLRDNGHVIRGWLGVLIQDVDSSLADSFGLSEPRGALVVKLLPDSPASRSALRPGDVILSFNGKRVANSSTLPTLVGVAPVNEVSSMEILRNGKKQTIDIVIGEMDRRTASFGGHDTRDEVRDGSRMAKLGLVVKALDERQRAKIRPYEGGVEVTEVLDGPAARAGIQSGDYIIMVENRQVINMKGFKQIVDGLPSGKTVAVLIQRDNGPMFVAMKLDP